MLKTFSQDAQKTYMKQLFQPFSFLSLAGEKLTIYGCYGNIVQAENVSVKGNWLNIQDNDYILGIVTS